MKENIIEDTKNKETHKKEIQSESAYCANYCCG